MNIFPLYKLTRMLTPSRMLLQIKFPPKINYCVICQRKTLLIRTDISPRIGNRCISCHSTAHHRGIFSVLCNLFGNDLSGLKNKSVYEISHHGALFNKLKIISDIVPFTFCSSEFDENLPFGVENNGIRNENIEQLSFVSNSFDIVTSTGLMEHVENDLIGFKEILRCLKVGGLYIFTVPISYNRPETILRAERAADGRINYLLEPEYHDDPFRGEKNVFTWRNYGTDLIDSLNDIGFKATLEKVNLPNISEPMPIIVAEKSY